MSRTSRGTIVDQVCKKFLSWKTITKTVEVDGEPVETIDKGVFTWYDKDKQENVQVKMPFRFVLLNADLVNFKGYDEGRKRGVWSNEVRDENHVVTIQAKNEKLMSFKLKDWKENKDKAKGFGAKYGRSVYIAVETKKGEWEIWNLQLGGAAMHGSNDLEAKNVEEKFDGWFNFSRENGNKIYDHYLEVADYKTKKKGKNKFTIPVFTLGKEIEDATKFDELDNQLTEYLEYYFSKKDEAPVKNEEEEVPVGGTPDTEEELY